MSDILHRDEFETQRDTVPTEYNTTIDMMSALIRVLVSDKTGRGLEAMVVVYALQDLRQHGWMNEPPIECKCDEDELTWGFTSCELHSDGEGNPIPNHLNEEFDIWSE